MYPVIFLSLFVFWCLIFLFIRIGISSDMKKKTKQCTAITSATVLRDLQEKYRDIDHNTTYTFHPVLEYFVNEGRIETKYTIGTAKVKYIICICTAIVSGKIVTVVINKAL